MSNRTKFLRQSAKGFYLCSLALFILPQGAPEPVPHLLAIMALALAAGLAAPIPIDSFALSRIVRDTWLLAGVLIVYVLAQSVSFAGNPFAHPVWREVEGLLGVRGGAISVEPAATRAAVFPLIAPFLAFVVAIRLFPSDRDALSLLKILSLAGTIFALAGLVQFLAFPEGLFFAMRDGEDANLTGLFVNHNTAGTFVGIGSLAAIAWAIANTAGHGAINRAKELPSSRQLILPIACATICILALFLTRSRGALLASFVAYLCLGFLLVRAINSTLSTKRPGRCSSLAMIGTMLIVVVILVIEVFGSRTATRLSQEGIDVVRLCVYAATLDGIRENLLFGTGFGTFSSVFPHYRTADCLGMNSTFFRAHNIYLEALLGLGIPVTLATFGFLYFRIGRTLTKGWRNRRRLRYVSAIGISGVILVTLHGMTDFSLQIPGMAVYFASFLASTVTVSLKRRSTRQAARLSDQEASQEMEKLSEPGTASESE